ncbi:MAG: NAD-dependent succinate-semialdehyde dehydrogenase [Chloroflexota bacterium]
MKYESINPATGEHLKEFADTSNEELEKILARAREAFSIWRSCTLEERAEPMRRLAQVLRRDKERLAGLVTTEMGKPITEAEAEIEKCAWGCEYYSDHALEHLRAVQIKSNARESYVEFDPLGIILAVMPWNYPFWQVMRFGVPAFMAGNGAVVKHSPNTPQSALAIEEVFATAGFPDGLVSNVFLSNEAADETVADPRIAAVTLTGSTRAGSEVASAAGRAVKKAVLELGGSDPFIVLEDADLAGAVQFAVKARFQNTGQSCIAAKRFIAVESVADEFERQFVDAVKALKVGDPTDHATQIGPLARQDLRDNLERQVNESVRLGACVLTGGAVLERPGYFYAPTILTEVQPNMPVWNQEVFGPAAPVMRVRDADEAIEVANATEYGLGSNLWTQDLDRAKTLARRIEAGNVFINGMTASDPRLPFGGVKRSGYGRELSAFGIHEFTNVKTVWIGPAESQQQQTNAAE